MRHLRKGRKLNRNASHRKALFNNMATSLLDKGRITTTIAKAKELRGVVERVITIAKRANLNSRRIAGKTIKNETVLKKLFDKVAPDFSTRTGGYTRILKLGERRLGDAAELAIIELVGFTPKPKVKRDKKKGKETKPEEVKEVKEAEAAAAE
jgi:large subunit ribosomal protein L17